MPKKRDQNQVMPTSNTTISPNELFAPCIVPSLASSTVPPCPASSDSELPASGVPAGMAVVRVVTPMLGMKLVVGDAGGFVTAAEPDVEKKYPTGSVGQGRVTTLFGVAVPSTLVIGLP